MRNAFVVLVSLCIGVVSGFIVPSSSPENIGKNNISMPDTSRGAKVNDQKLMTTTKSAVLPKNRTNIDEKDLFEHATEKRNNQSERAYVYINQKYNRIKHPRNKRIKVAGKLTSANANVGPPPTLKTAEQMPCVGCQKAFSPVPNYNTKYPGFTFEGAKHRQGNLGLAAPEMFRWNFNEKPEENDNVLKMQIPAVSDTRYNRFNERRDFVELLKKPLLRPESHKESYKKVNQIDVPIILPSITPISETFTKGYLKNQYVNKLKEVNTRQNEIRKKYVFNGAFIGSPYQIEKLRNRAEELSFINEDENRKNVEINQEEDGLLEKFIKDTLDENMPLAHDRVRAVPPNCAKEDCTTRKKYAKNNNVILKPICRGDRNLSLKEAEPFISNDRSLREDKRDRNETVLTSSEIMNYEEMLSEGSNQISEDNPVIGPRNTQKSNSTSH